MKTIITFFILILFLSCSNNKKLNIINYISKQYIDSEIYSSFNTITKKKQNIVIYYSEERTQSIKQGTIKNDNSPDISFIDKVDINLKLNTNIGYHNYLINNDKEYLLYKDIESEKKSLFKILTRNFVNERWEVFPINIEPDFFSSTIINNNIYVFYFDNFFKIGKFINDNFYDLTCDKIINNIDKISSISFIDNNLINIIYTDIEKNIYKLVIKENNRNKFNIIENKLISKNILFYTISENKTLLEYGLYFYNEKEKNLNYYNSRKNSTDIIGYFNNIHSISFIYYKNQPIFFYSGYNYSENKDNYKYSVSIIYNKNPEKQNWIEEEIYFSETPIISISNYIEEEKIYICCGGNELILLSFNTNILY